MVKLRKIRQLTELLGKEIHSNGYMPTGDKISMLAKIRNIKKEIDEELQLSLFSPEQLERKQK